MRLCDVRSKVEKSKNRRLQREIVNKKRKTFITTLVVALGIAIVMKLLINKWADDICWLVAVWSNLNPEKQITKYEKFIERFPNARIEEWTMKHGLGRMSIPAHINVITPPVLAQYKIGWIYSHRLEEYEKAIPEYQKVIDAFPDITSEEHYWIVGQIVVTYHQIAKCYEKLEKIEKAKETYREIIDRFPDKTKVAKIAQQKINELGE